MASAKEAAQELTGVDPKIKPLFRNSAFGKQFFSRIGNLGIVLIIPVILVLLWEYCGQTGVIKQTVLPTPSRIGTTLLDVVFTGELWKHVSISLLRVGQGYLVGAALGLGLGILMGIFKIADQLMSLLTGLLRPIPMVAWVPVLVLWLGIDEVSKISIIAIGTFWPVWVNVLSGIRNTDVKYIEISEVLNKSKFVVLTRIILPSALPAIFTGLRVGVGTAWISVITAELIAGASGLGFMIQYARELIQPDVMLVGVFVIGIIGFLIDLVLRQVERKIIRWDTSLGRK